MPITCICPACQKTLAIGEEYAGQAMRCPLCMALFQAPATMPQNLPANVGAPGGAAPPWQAPPLAPNGPQMARGPAWGGVGDSTRPRSAPLEGQEWDAVRGAAAGAKLEAGWHMVRRGLALMPLSLLALFAVFAATEIILLFDLPDSVRDMVLLIRVPTIIITGVLAVIGAAMCTLVPPQSGARNLALGGAASLLGCLLVFFLTKGIALLAGSKTASSAITAAYLPTLLLLLAGCILFMLFGRMVARHLNHKRLGQSALVCAISIGTSPVVLLILTGLVRMTAASINPNRQEPAQGEQILVGLIVSVVIAVDLLWFLRVAGEVRGAVLRGFVTTAV